MTKFRIFPLATLSGKYKRLVVPIGFEDRPEFLLSTLQPSIRVPFSFLSQSLSILRYSFSFKLVHSTTSFIAMNARDLFFVLPEMCVAALVAIIISSAVTEPSPILVSSLTSPTVRNSLKYFTFFFLLSCFRKTPHRCPSAARNSPALTTVLPTRFHCAYAQTINAVHTTQNLQPFRMGQPTG